MKTLKKLSLFIILVLMASSLSYAQVAISTDNSGPDASAMVDVKSTDKGFLPPCMTTDQRDGITSPAEGLTIYNTDEQCIEFWDGTQWNSLCCPLPAEPSEIVGETVPSLGATETYSITEVVGVNYAWTVPADWTIESGQGTHTISVTVGEDPGNIEVTPSNACGSGTARTLVVYPVVPLPGNITLGSRSDYFIASIYDEDYSPYTVPAGPAVLPGTAADEADGTPDSPTIDYQGTLSTTGVTIKIPYTVVTASVNLPAFIQSINVPADLTEDGVSRDITLEWSAQALGVGSGVLNATLKAEVGTLNTRKLDIQTGVGADVLGILLGQFTYASDDLGGTEIFYVRLIVGIPDKSFGIQTTLSGGSPAYNHWFLYLPVYNSATGKTWLNNNLGANYANINKSVFNPGQQATASNDANAYGSLFQWGRFSDSHEFRNSVRISFSQYGYPNTPVPNLGNSWDGKFIQGQTGYNSYSWLSYHDNTLWPGVSAANNPCPIGYRVPTTTELETERLSWNSNNPLGAYSSPLKLSATGQRTHDQAVIEGQGQVGVYWSSSGGGSATALMFGSWGAQLGSSEKAKGHALRCIKN